MITIKNALEELNYLNTGDYSDHEFYEKFKLNPHANINHLDLEDTGRLAKKLDVNHQDLVPALIKLQRSKQS